MNSSDNVLKAFTRQAETGAVSYKQADTNKSHSIAVKFSGRQYIKFDPVSGQVTTTSVKGERASLAQIQQLYRQAMQDQNLNNADAAKLEKAMSAIIFQEHTKVSKPLLAKIFPFLKPTFKADLDAIKKAEVEKNAATRTQLKRPIEKTQIARYYNIQEATKSTAENILNEMKHEGRVPPQQALGLYVYTRNAFSLINQHLRKLDTAFEKTVNEFESKSKLDEKSPEELVAHLTKLRSLSPTHKSQDIEKELMDFLTGKETSSKLKGPLSDMPTESLGYTLQAYQNSQSASGVKEFKQNLMEEILTHEQANKPLDGKAIDTLHGECQLISEQATQALDQLTSVDSSKMLYRGASFPQSMWQDMVSRNQLQDAAFLSTTYKPEVAMKFLKSEAIKQPENVRVIFAVTSHRSAKDVSALSHYATESECLFKPGTAFDFGKIIQKNPGTPDAYFIVQLNER